MTARLCYVKDSFAWFTTALLSDQTGDDWDDAPYEDNAGEPYEWQSIDLVSQYRLTKLAYEVPNGQTPDTEFRNSPYSVDQINAGAVAWVRSDKWADHAWAILAGATPEEFTRIIQAAGGTVYTPVHALVPV